MRAFAFCYQNVRKEGCNWFLKTGSVLSEDQKAGGRMVRKAQCGGGTELTAETLCLLIFMCPCKWPQSASILFQCSSWCRVRLEFICYAEADGTL